MRLGGLVEQIIRQNNAIDVYEKYFTEEPISQLKQDTPRFNKSPIFINLTEFLLAHEQWTVSAIIVVQNDPPFTVHGTQTGVGR